MNVEIRGNVPVLRLRSATPVRKKLRKRSLDSRVEVMVFSPLTPVISSLRIARWRSAIYTRPIERSAAQREEEIDQQKGEGKYEVYQKYV
jgi:hypothetical protein